MPNYTLGQQVRKDDERIKTTYETYSFTLLNGNGYIRGYFVRPFSQETRTEMPMKLPAVLVVHENRGLNPHTEDVARRFGLENFIAFAPDADDRRFWLSQRRLQGRSVVWQGRSHPS